MPWDTVKNPLEETSSDLFTGSERLDEAGVMPRRYLAKESMLVISRNSCCHSSDSAPESGDTGGVGMFSPKPNLPYEDEEIAIFLT